MHDCVFSSCAMGKSCWMAPSSGSLASWRTCESRPVRHGATGLEYLRADIAESDDQSVRAAAAGHEPAVRCSVLSVRAMACATTAKPAEGRHRGGRSKTDLPWRRYE